MGGYLESGGLTTWYDEQGVGEPLVLLHGGLCTNATWAEQMSDLSAQFRVIAPERRGHGHTPDIEGPLSYDAMAADTIAFLTALVGGPAHLLGWSDGQSTISVEQLGGITACALVVVGDHDIVTLDHTVSLFRAIPNSELAVVPGTSHFAAMEKPELVNRLVLDFLQRDPVPTYMPLRRAADGADHEG